MIQDSAHSFVTYSSTPTRFNRVSDFSQMSKIKRARSLKSLSENDKEADEASILLEKVTKMRAEIAALEGKSIQEVQEEAQERKKLTTRKTVENKSTDPMKKKGKKWGATKPDLPEDNLSQIVQAAGAVERAQRDGLSRQLVRFALIPEGDTMYDMQEWPGGPQQISREAGVPLTVALLKELKMKGAASESGQVYVQDILDFDGSAWVTKRASLPLAEKTQDDVVKAMVLANTDDKYINDIRSTDENFIVDGDDDDKLFLLVNPFWRNLESWGFNIFSPNAKKNAQKHIFDRGFQNETYAFNRFSARGELCAALKVYPFDWQMFAYLEDDYYGGEYPIYLGQSEEEPSYSQYVTQLNEREEFKLSKNMRILQRMQK